MHGHGGFEAGRYRVRLRGCLVRLWALFETGAAYHQRGLHVDSNTTCLVLQDRITTVNLCFSTTIDE
jgi:hypothetical protein